MDADASAERPGSARAIKGSRLLDAMSLTVSTPAWRDADPELALLVACAGWPASDRRVQAIRACVAAGVDWTRFGRIVRRHRMAGMALDGLSTAGIAVPTCVREAARADLIQALETAREAVRLVAALAATGIAATVLKGPPLAMMVYGTLAVRQVRDLDLLVAPADLARAMLVLEEQGCWPRKAGNGIKLRPDRSWVHKDVEFCCAATGVIVELHARLSENAELLPVAMTGAVVPVTIASGMSLPALTGEPLLLYLMVHGFRHGWHRLKWLGDVAGIVAAMPEPALGAFMTHARRCGLGVVATSTLLLLDYVMAVELPPAILAMAAADRRARWCAAVARRRLFDVRDVDAQVMTGLLATATRLLASSRPSYLTRELGRLLIDNGVAIPLGGGRAALLVSVVLRPVMLPARHLVRAWHLRRAEPTQTDF